MFFQDQAETTRNENERAAIVHNVCVLVANTNTAQRAFNQGLFIIMKNEGLGEEAESLRKLMDIVMPPLDAEDCPDE